MAFTITGTLPAQSSEPSRFEYAWHGFSNPTVNIGDRSESLDTCLQTPNALAQEDRLRLRQVYRYRSWSHACFWSGIAGMIMSLSSERSHHVPSRTFGNALWGTGIVGWLGIGATIQGELADLSTRLPHGPEGILSFENNWLDFSQPHRNDHGFHVGVRWQIN